MNRKIIKEGLSNKALSKRRNTTDIKRRQRLRKVTRADMGRWF